MGKIVRVKNLMIGQGRPKICAIVLGKTTEEIMDLAEKSNNVDCDLIEFRADHFEDALDLGKTKSLLRKIKRVIKKPMIFTFRRFEEGGNVEAPIEYYKALLNMVADANLADLIDVEASVAKDDPKLVPGLKEMDACVIISKHDFDKTPDKKDILLDFLNMQSMGADIVKMAYMPNSKKDVLNLINAADEITGDFASCPVVTISMGHLGMVTRVLGEFIESPITFAAITKSSAPGQVNVEGLKSVLDIIHENYKKVFLIGFMGTGKTTVANALAANYGLNKIDLDAYIESKEHMSIADIFSTQSESVFRDKETKYLKQVLKKNYQVVSLGGGIVLREENVDLMKEKGVIVLLKASPQTISERVKNDKTRPLLGENFDLDYIKDLMKQREEAYDKVADLVIDTDDKNVDQICKEIVETLGFTL